MSFSYDVKTYEVENGNQTRKINPVHGMYLDWLNNYVGIDTFAEHYQISTDTAKAIINAGRLIHKGEA